MSDATHFLLLQCLAWIALKPRTYRETVEAWRTSCPRMPVWEDALDERLVELRHVAGVHEVVLTAKGRAMLSAESCAA